MTNEDLKTTILALIKKEQGMDSEEIAKRLDIDDGLASDLCQELQREGRLKSYSRMVGLPVDPNSTASWEL